MRTNENQKLDPQPLFTRIMLSQPAWEEITDYSGYCGCEGTGYTAEFEDLLLIMDVTDNVISIQAMSENGAWQRWDLSTASFFGQ